MAEINAEVLTNTTTIKSTIEESETVENIENSRDKAIKKDVVETTTITTTTSTPTTTTPIPSRTRTLMRAPEMDADTDDVDSITAELVRPLSASLSSTIAPPSPPSLPPPQLLPTETNGYLDNGKPFKIKDITRHIRKAVVATSLAELCMKVTLKFQRPQPAIHLDCDGTEVDDEEYFGTLEPNTELIAVFPGEQWRDPSDYNANYHRTSLDTQRLRKLVSRLQNNYFNDADLDSLSNMDPNSLTDITGRDIKETDVNTLSVGDADRRSTELSC